MDAEIPMCKKCDLENHIVEMIRVFKPNAKPGSKDGSWGFGGNKPTLSGPGIHQTPEAAMRSGRGKSK